jgi:hypothetical protein
MHISPDLTKDFSKKINTDNLVNREVQWDKTVKSRLKSRAQMHKSKLNLEV